MKIQQLLNNAISQLKNELNKKNSKESKTIRDAIIAADHNLSLITLEEIINKLNPEAEATQENLKPLADFLGDRWQRIQSTPLAYTATPNDNITTLMLNLSHALHPIFKQPTYQLMMPTIKVTENMISSTSLDDKDLKLHHIVLSDDNSRYIEVQSVLDYSSDGILKHNSIFDGATEKSLPAGVKRLSAKEHERIVNHSNEAKQYYQAIQLAYNVKNNGMSVGAYVQRFAKSLHNGGKYKHGNEFNAAADANEAMVDFFDNFIKKLNTEEKANLDTRTAEGLSDNFATLCKYLLNPQFDEKQRELGSRFCIETIAGNIERILEGNPDLYNKYPKQKADSKTAETDIHKIQQQVTESREALQKALSHEPFKVNYAYGDEGEKRLLENTSKILFEKMTVKINNCLIDQKQSETNKVKLIKCLLANTHPMLNINTIIEMDAKFTDLQFNSLLNGIGQPHLRSLIPDIAALKNVLIKLPVNHIPILLNQLGKDYFTKLVKNNVELATFENLPPNVFDRLKHFAKLDPMQKIIDTINKFNNTTSPEILDRIFSVDRVRDYLVLQDFIDVMQHIPLDRANILISCFGENFFRQHINSASTLIQILSCTPVDICDLILNQLDKKFLSSTVEKEIELMATKLSENKFAGLLYFINNSNNKPLPLLPIQPSAHDVKQGNDDKREVKTSDCSDSTIAIRKIHEMFHVKCEIRSFTPTWHEIKFTDAKSQHDISKIAEKATLANIAATLQYPWKPPVANKMFSTLPTIIVRESLITMLAKLDQWRISTDAIKRGVNPLQVVLLNLHNNAV